MILLPPSRPTQHRYPIHQAEPARLPRAALQGWALLVVVWAMVAGCLAQPAQASDDGPPQYRYVPTLSTPRSALTQPAILDEPAPLAEPKLFQVFLPLTVASRQVVLDDVELVNFTYRLQEGDDLAMLALVWGVDSELMACVTRSGQEALSGLRPGMVIMIANPRYRCHTVQPDQSVKQIAGDYGVAVDVLLAEPWNLLESTDEALEPGRRLLILDGERPDLARLRESQPVTATRVAPQPTATPQGIQPWPYGDGQFVWPVQGGVISQGFRTGHRAIDIAAPVGTPVYAADNGIVIQSGYSKDGYGGRVIIDHQIDYVTLYAHLSQALVEVGDVVQKGQLIGYVGSTGNSTGPHIHFEIRDFGFLVDPRSLLAGD